MSQFVPVRPAAHNAAPCLAPASNLKLVAKAKPRKEPRRRWSWPKLTRAMEAIERFYGDGRRARLRGRRGAGLCTRKLARAALVEIGEVVALVACHLPMHTKRQRAYEHAAIEPILTAIANATGHCPKCGIRVASWAAATGYPLAFEPCPEHRAAKAAGGASW